MPDTTSPAARLDPLLGLVATMLALALTAIACSAPGDAQEGLRELGSPAGHPGRPDGSPFDTSRPSIRRLDPDLREAVQAAARDARRDGVTVVVTSGWRSRAHQQRLFDEAVSKYGGVEEALRWVSTPDTSAHVTGDAVDIGPSDADEWLDEHGADYGLCQVFANESWHFELATTPGGECPPMYPDSSSRS
jgi:LAS superfamily LD-carboxypeptidase LdcB